MKYIKNLERPSNLAVGSEVVFTLDDGTIYEGEVCLQNVRNKYYIELPGGFNNEIFRELGLDEYNFVHEIVGYELDGTWPETRTLEDLSKVLDALLKVNQPEETEEVEEKPKSSSEWDWLLG